MGKTAGRGEIRGVEFCSEKKRGGGKRGEEGNWGGVKEGLVIRSTRRGYNKESEIWQSKTVKTKNFVIQAGVGG